MKNLVELLKPEKVMVAKANIVGYAWDEEKQDVTFPEQKGMQKLG